jgi:hypothetical protein
MMLVLWISLASLIISTGIVEEVSAFTLSPIRNHASFSLTVLEAKKKRRRRKEEPDPVKTSMEQIEGEEDDDDDDDLEEMDMLQQQVTEDPTKASMIQEVANFEFEGDFQLNEEDMVDTGSPNTAIPLPDIREARKRKEMMEEVARVEEDKEDQRVRIKRTDKEAFRKLLEQQPFADADASYFEEEAYGTVSALLGENAAPFLGIPTGPLQIGHFIGALGIMLMAFVEYPGFPLTNLPTPLRDSLQGGLATIYVINIGLAVYATIKAAERGQPAVLWASKTFAVGGLALDQLTQLPTLKEVEERKAIKGKRALKNQKKSRK